MTMVQEVASNQAQDLIDAEDLPVLVDFQATWCGPCRLLDPVLGGLADELADRVRIVSVDVDSSRDFATSHHVASVPTLMLFRNGELVYRRVGATAGRLLRDDIEAALVD